MNPLAPKDIVDAQVRWTSEKASAWYATQPWLVGANYIASDAINQLEMFQKATWNPGLIDRELKLAADAGMNVIRVFLHDALWLSQDDLLSRLDEFFTIAAHHEIRTMPVLFDSCWDPEYRTGPQRPPIPGVHNSGWVQSPGASALGNPKAEARLRAYVQGVVRHFAHDQRVLLWDVWNEPDNGFGVYAETEPPDKIARVNSLLPKVFAWVREAGATQPLTSGVWSGNWSDPEQQRETIRIQLAQSDVVSFHNYDWPEGFEARIRELQPMGRPLLCTEYMARGAGSTFDTCLPIAKQHGVAAIHWGLVAGKTQTWLPWDSWQRPYVLQPPTVWFHDMFRADGSAYRPHEVEWMRRLTGRGGRPLRL